MNQPTKKKSLGRRLARIVIKSLLFIILLFVLVVILIQTGPVQNFIRKKAVAYLGKKLHTKVEVGKLCRLTKKYYPRKYICRGPAKRYFIVRRQDKSQSKSFAVDIPWQHGFQKY